MPQYNRIAIKVGSNVLTNSNGSLNYETINHIVEQIVTLRSRGIDIILVSSGAVAAGRSEVTLSKKTGPVNAKQVWSAIGQVKLMSTYSELFKRHDIYCAQVLTTKENFSDRRHYLNMQNSISAMLDNNILPIVNENDTISVTELMFTDNDELSGLMASMMQCEALFILSNIDGVYTGNPADEGTELIPIIDENTKKLEEYIAPTKSGFGRGGMITKCKISRKISQQGIDVFIANGTRAGIIGKIIDGENIPHTCFKASEQKTKSVKNWLAHSDTFAKGSVTINKGAQEALLSDKANSLLMVGITKVTGYFKKDDIVRIENENGDILAIGKAKIDSEKANEVKGIKYDKPFVHYDYLTLI